ncbi:MAG: sensor domain-containing diguanylate cyclase [bacterium]
MTVDNIINNDLKSYKSDIYKKALDGAGFGLWNWDVKTGKIECNQNWNEIVGFNGDELISDISDWERRIHPDDSTLVDKILKEHFEDRSSQFSIIYRIKTARGNWKWINTLGQIVKRDDENKALRVVGIHQDIDRRKTLELEMEKQRAFFEQLFANSPAGIVLMDNAGRIIKTNKSFQNIFGYKQHEVEGRILGNVLISEEKKEEWKKINDSIAGNNTVIQETVRKASDGSMIHVKVFGYPVVIKGKVEGIFAVYQDISERIKEEEEIRYLSFNDQLTGLYNRRYFENEMDRLDKSREINVGIIVADLDYLKDINDDFGHKKGDKYIQAAAKTIKNNIREADIAARIGGDEFAILLTDINEEILENISTRIAETYKRISQCSSNKYHISIGYAVKGNSDKTLEDVFVRADKRMYKNKQEYKSIGGML